MIVDVLLPGMNGLELCGRLRKDGVTAPILMLTARGEPDQRVEVSTPARTTICPSPTSPELHARAGTCCAAGRRWPRWSWKRRRPRDRYPRASSRARRQARAADHEEHALLEYLARRRGEVVGRADIAEHVWDDSFDPMSNLIEVYIQRLRRKIDDGHAVRLIHTHRGAVTPSISSMLTTLRIDGVRGRLTLFYVSVLAVALTIVGGLIYVLLARALFVRVDETLEAGVLIAATSLSNDLEEGQDFEDAARSTVAEQASSTQMLAVYDGQGRLVAGDATRPAHRAAAGGSAVGPRRAAQTVLERDGDDRHCLAFRRVSLPKAEYIVAVGADLEPMDEELEFLRAFSATWCPLPWWIAAIGGSFLAPEPAPVVAMADRARRIGVENLSERLPVANPRDELGAAKRSTSCSRVWRGRSFCSASSWPTRRTSCARR